MTASDNEATRTTADTVVATDSVNADLVTTNTTSVPSFDNSSHELDATLGDVTLAMMREENNVEPLLPLWTQVCVCTRAHAYSQLGMYRIRKLTGA